MLHATLRPALILAASLTALALTGCSGPKAIDEASIAEARRAQPTMAGETAFFDGKLLVEANLGRGFRPRLKREGARSRPGSYGTPGFEDEAARDYARDGEPEYFIPRMNNSTLPPVALRLRVTNQTSAPIEIEFAEFKSYLGNFAVRPVKLTIPAGESAEPDPMNSLLGVTGQEIPLTVGLRLAGKVETHLITMKVIKTPPVAPAASSAPKAP